MAATSGYRCQCCGEWHDEMAFAFHFAAPVSWRPELENDDRSFLDQEVCVVEDEFFFVRALIQLPVLDAGQEFDWGVWVSLSRASFLRMEDLWEVQGREAEEPYFGWLSSAIPLYEPTTVSLATQVHTRPVGLRPVLRLEATDHPLSVQQHRGITVAQVREFNERLPH